MLIRGTDARNALNGESGFTLLEMLAVVVLLALFATLATVKFNSHGGAGEARATLLNTSDILRHARITAVRSGIEQVVLVDVPHRRVDGVGHRPLQVPPELGFSAVTARSEQLDNAVFGIRFYPDGTSTGGELQFATHGKVYELRVNWLTGSVTISDG